MGPEPVDVVSLFGIPPSTLASKSEPNPDPIVLDHDGDLFLVVGGQFRKKTTFQVDASALRRASPVWKAMLFGPWKESKPQDGSKWIVKLPEDDVDALTVILGIIHNNYDSVPSDMTNVLLLWNILVVCDKYDMTRVLKPWIPSWAKNMKSLKNAHMQTIYIAWELGEEDWFASIFKDLVFNSGINRRDQLECILFGFWSLGFITTHLQPDRILDDIASIRLFLLKGLLDFLNTEIDLRLDDRKQGTSGQYACLHRNAACDDLLLGGIIRLTSKSLNDALPSLFGGVPSPPKPPTPLQDAILPPRDATKIRISVETVQSVCSTAFQHMKLHANAVQNGPRSHLFSHANCNPAERFATFVAKISSEASSKIDEILSSDDYKGRMANQRKKIGLKSS
ncbi:hypothetical protein QBC40DRAFT_85409 [Triangularia verruculosa]|uniref:BTB domain-containing protein n=1 Tax=Triangularia verruculosa TaxID=2587418 RepID=A0AAN6XH00_9PEZI|nr:hypothetical protein QBC40DRAFT_85409 [Triangularia verruculosa]